MGVHETLTGAQRTARYRAAKRAKGLRLKQIWVPDLSNPVMLAKLQLDAASLAAQGNRWAGIVDDAEAMSAEVLNDIFAGDAHPLADNAQPLRSAIAIACPDRA